jgi:hypothetical protein
LITGRIERWFGREVPSEKFEVPKKAGRHPQRATLRVVLGTWNFLLGTSFPWNLALLTWNF